MGKNSMRKFRWFWAWQDEEEEAWLREMSKEGWHLNGIGFPTIYDFESGEAKDTIYRLDYRSYWKMDKEDYQQLFQDAGWEYIQEMAGWQYFRKPAEESEDLEIYTDAESKIGKYQRLLGFLGILTLPLMFSVINLRNPPYKWMTGVEVFSLLMILLFVYAGIKILTRINQLKRL